MASLTFLESDTPARGGPPEQPVMLLLHGFGSNERDLPSLTPFLPPMPWVSLRAPLAMPPVGAAWFALDPPHEPEQAAIDEATGALWSWIDAELDVRTPVVPVGFSQGGLMASELLRSRPERIAATVVLAGFVGPEPHEADARLAHELPPVFWGRGKQDAVIWPSAIERTSRVLPQISTLTARTYAGLGHGVNEPMLDDVRIFLEGAGLGTGGTRDASGAGR